MGFEVGYILGIEHGFFLCPFVSFILLAFRKTNDLIARCGGLCLYGDRSCCTTFVPRTIVDYKFLCYAAPISRGLLVGQCDCAL